VETISKFYPTFAMDCSQIYVTVVLSCFFIGHLEPYETTFITTEDPIVNNHLKGLLASGIQFSELPAIIHCQYQERVGDMANVQL
jgi:hypothetical protein